jgi:hypothetical protein
LRLKILTRGIALFYSLDKIAAIVTNHLERKIKGAFPTHFFAPPFGPIFPQTIKQIQTKCQVIILGDSRKETPRNSSQIVADGSAVPPRCKSAGLFDIQSLKFDYATSDLRYFGTPELSALHISRFTFSERPG